MADARRRRASGRVDLARLETAREQFLATCDLITDSPSIADQFCRPRLANGSESVATRDGARLKISAATRAATRGLSVDLMLSDELREWDTWEPWCATSKTTMARGAARATLVL